MGTQPTASIGVFDSGVGGMTVLKAIHQLLPAESLLYVADQAHVPYGSRSLEQIQGFAEGITNWLLKQGVRLVVIACNTASAAALHYLRQTFPQTIFVGMEPAIKPAVERTRRGVVGVLATPATFQGLLYASLLERFTHGVTILQDTCPGLVEQIEAGNLEGEATRRILENALQPMLEAGADAIVLGCTHYPFITHLIQQIVGDNVAVIDPAPAVARQVARMLNAHGLGNLLQVEGKVRFYTSGDASSLQSLITTYWGRYEPVSSLDWQGGSLCEEITNPLQESP